MGVYEPVSSSDFLTHKPPRAPTLSFQWTRSTVALS